MNTFIRMGVIINNEHIVIPINTMAICYVTPLENGKAILHMCNGDNIQTYENFNDTEEDLL